MNQSIQEQPTSQFPAVRRRVHITLVGGQIAPVLNVIEMVNPHLVEMVYSNESAQSIKKLCEQVATVEVVESAPLSPFEPKEIIERAEQLAAKYADDEVTLNISGGTKPWSYLFGLVMHRMDNVTIVYVNQNGQLWDYTHMELLQQHVLEFDIFKSFAGNKTPLTDYGTLDGYTEADDRVVEQIEEIRHSHWKQFNSLFVIQDKREQDEARADSGVRNVGDSMAVWSRKSAEEGGDSVVSIVFGVKGDVEKYELRSPHAHELVFNAHWFEYKVARLFSRWDKARGVYVNCVFRAANDQVINEVDVIIDAGIKPFLVECKTQVTKSTDLDKFHTVLKNYAGLAAKGIVMTDVPKHDDVKEKCRRLGLMDFYYGRNMDEQRIFAILDKELQKSNTK